MTYHILNGDALLDMFYTAGLEGEVVVTRECLVEGNLEGESPATFYQTRAHYIKTTYGGEANSYFTRVAGEFEKLTAAPNNSEFNLWFGYDLFCRANMWFVLSLLSNLPIKKQIFAVYPSYLKGNEIWKDFGSATSEDLVYCFNNKILFGEEDLQLGKELWLAFKYGDLLKLEKLSKKRSACFPYLEEVCRAHIDRFPGSNRKSRPERVMEELFKSTTDFPAVFTAFSRREGVYGFGDVQVKRIYDKAMQNH